MNNSQQPRGSLSSGERFPSPWRASGEQTTTAVVATKASAPLKIWRLPGPTNLGRSNK
jgi:hypothetical protein